MTEFQRVAEVDDISPGQGKIVEVAGQKIALFNVAGDFHAIDNGCTHRGGPLGEGRLEETTVTCPWHGARFDVTSGQVLSPPAPTQIESYPTKVEDGSVWLEI